MATPVSRLDEAHLNASARRRSTPARPALPDQRQCGVRAKCPPDTPPASPPSPPPGPGCREAPPDVSSGPAFQQYLCRVHNTVNRRLGKPAFNCALAPARWQPLDCEDADGRQGCSLAPLRQGRGQRALGP